MPSDADANYEFRVGLICEENPRVIFWLRSEWIDKRSSSDFKFIAKIGETIVVQKRDRRTGETATFEWNLRERWPSSAREGSAAAASWSF